MKKLLNKHSMYAVAAFVLLGMAALIIGCSDPFSPRESYTPPEGMGYVRINLRNAVSRSILPTTPAVTAFNAYELAFTLEGGTGPGPTAPISRNAGNIGAPIDLNPGEYSLIITAFQDTGATLPWATWSTTTDFVISDGSSETFNVTLQIIPPSTGTVNGTFTRNITFTGISATDIDTAELTISPVGGSGSPVDFSDSIPGGYSLSAPLLEGYYYVDIEMEAVGGPTVFLRQVLHVYRYLTSTLNQAFTAAHFGITPAPGQGSLEIDNLEVGTIGHTPPVVTVSQSTMSIGSNDSSLLTVTNNSPVIYSGGIQYWSGSILLGTGDDTTIDVTMQPFDMAGATTGSSATHFVTVVGIDAAGVPHATIITITVTP